MLTYFKNQTHSYMSGIHHTPAQNVSRSREEKENLSSMLGQEHLDKSIYHSAILAAIPLLIVHVKKMRNMMTILLIQQALRQWLRQ